MMTTAETQKWDFAKEFTLEFQGSCSDLRTRIEEASQGGSKEKVDELAEDIAKVAKSLLTATGSLPVHDQRAYESQLKELETSLGEIRAIVAPKGRFSFKRKVAVIQSKDKPIALSKYAESSAGFSIHKRSNEYLTADSLQSLSSELLVSDLDSCILNLCSSTNAVEISALHVQNLSNTVLLLPAIKGSVLLHDLKRCTIVVGCHQFRMHASTDVDIYLSISSNPIIEHSNKVRFAPYPFGPKSGSSPDISPQDFSHIKTSPSPNWSQMDPESVVTRWPLEKVKVAAMHDVLEKLLPPAVNV